MSHLPITASPAPAAIAPKSSTPNDDGGTQQGSTFGAVLARQVAAPDANDGKAVHGKAADKTGKDGSAESLTSDAASKADLAAAIPPTTAPATDMLAALLPQVLAPAAAATAGKVAPDDALRAAMAGRKEAKVSPGMMTDLTTTTATAFASNKASAGIADSAAVSFEATLNTQSTNGKNSLAASSDKLEPLLSAPPRLPDAAALASLQNSATQLAATSVLPTQVVINTPVTQDRWGDEFNQKITWLATNKEQSAELHLNPPELGPVDVVLKVSGDQATAMFTSPHAAVREVIEQAMPKLREMLADNGIMLGNATVNDQATRDNNRQNDFAGRGQNGVTNRSETAVAAIPEAGATRVTTLTRHNNVVDTFA